MSKVCACVYQGDFERPMRTGDGLLAALKVTTDATAGNRTITANAIRGGVCQFTGAAGAVTYTSPTATQLNAVFDDMDIGETYSFFISNTAAQVATIAGGTDVTASGNLTINATYKLFVLEKDSATTFKLIGL